MKVKMCRVIISFFTAFFLLAFSVNCYAKNLSISPTTVSGSPGSEVSINVMLDDPSGIAGAEFRLNYDSDVLEYVVSEKGAVVSGFSQVNDIAGIDSNRYVFATFADSADISENTESILYVFNFIVKTDAHKNSTLQFSNTDFSNADLDTIDVDSVNGTFTITGIPTGTITLTTDPTSLIANGSSTTTINSSAIEDSAGNNVPDGTKITISTNRGIITTPDTDENIGGIQVLTSNGIITFVLQSDLTIGSATITANSVAGGATGNTTVAFTAIPATSFIVSGITNPIIAGTSSDVTVKAIGEDGLTATGYTGTVKFSSSDSQADLPDNYTFVAEDNGVHTFDDGVTLKTAGEQSITATDTTDENVNGSQTGIVVNHSDAIKIELKATPTQISCSFIDKSTLTAKILDAFGNVVDTSDQSVTFAVTEATYGDIKGEETVTAENGIATRYVESKIHDTGGDITCTADATGLTQGTDIVKTVPRTLLTIAITIEDGSSEPEISEIVQFKATGTYSDGSTKVITNDVTWASLDIAKGTIDNAGLFTADNGGSTNITATLLGVTSNVITVEVQPAELIELFDTSKLPEMIEVGKSVDFEASIFDNNGGTGEGFIYTIDSEPVDAHGILTADGKFSIDGTKAFAGVYKIVATDKKSKDYDEYIIKVSMVITPDSSIFNETKLDGTDNPQTFTVTGASSDYTWEILDSEDATNEVDNPDEYGTWADNPDNVNIFTPANITTIMKFYIRVTVTGDDDLTNENGLNKVVAGPFRIIPVDTFTVSVVDENGDAISGANVSVDDPDVTAQKTDADGKASFILPDTGKKYDYAVTATGYVSKNVSSDEKNVTVELETAGGDTITGTVQDSSDSNLENATVIAYQSSDLETSYEATWKDGAYTINLPYGASKSGWVVVASCDGYVSKRQTDQSVDTAVDFTGENALQLKTVISVTTEVIDDTVQIEITADPVFSDDAQVDVELKNGSGNLNALSYDDNTISVTYDTVENFKVIIKADTSEDDDPNVGYWATYVLNYVANDLAKKRTRVEVGAGEKASLNDTDVKIPLYLDNVAVEIAEVDADNAGDSIKGSGIVEIVIFDEKGELIDKFDNGIEITIKFDSAIADELRNGTYVIYTTKNIENMIAGKNFEEVPQPYDIDFLNCKVTFKVYHLSAFGVGETGASSEAVLIDDSSDSRCFIATAAYGSPFESHVEILRNFRDTYLLPTKIGSAFVKTYYNLSPKAAAFIAEHDSLKALTRVALLPVIGISYMALNMGFLWSMIAIVGFMTFVALITIRQIKKTA